jgi:outer membrane protein TolC
MSARRFIGYRLDRTASQQVAAELSAPRPIPEVVSEVPVGLPSDLLERRPDVRAAQRRIAQANARIGIARADLYPHFSLTAVAGLESLNLSSFTDCSIQIAGGWLAGCQSGHFVG